MQKFKIGDKVIVDGFSKNDSDYGIILSIHEPDEIINRTWYVVNICDAPVYEEEMKLYIDESSL